MSFYFSFASIGHKALLKLADQALEQNSSTPPEAIEFVKRAILTHPDGALIAVTGTGHWPAEYDVAYKVPAKMDITVTPLNFTPPKPEGT